MSDPVERVFARLRREYLDEMPARIEELERARREGDTEGLRVGLHQLAGSGGSHGFPAISTAARAIEAQLGRATIDLAPLRVAIDEASARIR